MYYNGKTTQNNINKVHKSNAKKHKSTNKPRKVGNYSLVPHVVPVSIAVRNFSQLGIPITKLQSKIEIF